MADTNYAATPQSFTFGTSKFKDLKGFVVSFSGRTPRRHVTHEFLKRRGAKIEDMEGGPRHLDVRLVFLGENCAKEYRDFLDSVQEHPRGLLTHPTAGKWQAFCEGPQEDVDLQAAVDKISVRVAWVEDNIGQEAVDKTPDVATAAQNTTSQQSQFEQDIGKVMGEIAIAQTFNPDAISAITSSITNIGTVTNPITAMLSTITTQRGIQPAVIEQIISIADTAEILSQSVTDYVEGSTDLFNGGDVEAGSSDSGKTLLGIVQDNTITMEDVLIAADQSPAGTAESVGSAEDMLSNCMILDEAIRAERPPLILFTVPELTDVITLAQKHYQVDASARASEILGLNRIPNPAAIPAGTRLFIPSR